MLPDKLVIPHICRNSNLLITVIVTELVVILFWLVNAQNTNAAAFGLWSLYGLWLVLISTFLLCLFRQTISLLPYFFGVLCVVAIYLVVLLLIEVFIANQASTGAQANDLLKSAVITQLNLDRVTRLSAAGLIVIMLLLRFFAYLNIMESRNKAEAESRVLALQSKIQPHFLFNSLNTISELTVQAPDQAEKAINSLAMLFRASLENDRTEHSLEHELTLCQRYIELERWRLGDKLDVQWQLEVKNPNAWRVPKLILQPLVENAIVHGKQETGDIQVAIDLRESSKYLSLMIENKFGVPTENSSGHGIALDNIRERLFTLYDDQQLFRIKQSNNVHSVLMRIPKQTRA